MVKPRCANSSTLQRYRSWLQRSVKPCGQGHHGDRLPSPPVEIIIAFKQSLWWSLHISILGDFNPIEKYGRQTGESSPNRGENTKYLKPPPRFWLSFQKCILNVAVIFLKMETRGHFTVWWKSCYHNMDAHHKQTKHLKQGANKKPPYFRWKKSGEHGGSSIFAVG